MTKPSLAGALRLFLELWRIRLGRLAALRASRAFAAIAERLLAPELRGL